MASRGRYTAQIVISVTPQVRTVLEQMAEDEGTSLAHVARQMIDRSLKDLETEEESDAP